jgi:hypothetical protein
MTHAQINLEIREVQNVVYVILRNSDGNTLYSINNDTDHFAFVREDVHIPILSFFFS